MRLTGMRGSSVTGSDAFVFGALSLLSLLLLVPWLERPLVRRSINDRVSTLKMLIVVPVSGLVALQGGAGLLSIDFIADYGQGAVMLVMLGMWVAFLYLAVFPGPYSKVLDRMADPSKRGISMATRNIKARMTFDAHPRGYTRAEVKKRSRFPDFVVKILAVFIVLLAAVSFYGSRATNFIPNPEIVNWVSSNGILFAVATALSLLFVLLFSPDRSPKFYIKSQVLRSFLLAGMMGVAVFAGMGRSFATGLPALYAEVMPGLSGQIRVVVVRRGAEDSTGLCTQSAHVRPPNWAANDTFEICAIPIAVWRGLEPGMTLVLRGNRSRYGFSYEAIGRDWTGT